MAVDGGSLLVLIELFGFSTSESGLIVVCRVSDVLIDLIEKDGGNRNLNLNYISLVLDIIHVYI